MSLKIVTEDGMEALRYPPCGRCGRSSFVARSLPEPADSFGFFTKVKCKRCGKLYVAYWQPGPGVIDIFDEGPDGHIQFPDNKPQRPVGLGHTDIDNLNNACIRADGEDRSLIDPSTVVGHTEVVFRNLKARFIRLIGEYPVVCGCVAWFTDFGILDALAGCRAVAFLVQKEDFLRPDHTDRTWKMQLAQKYAALRGTKRFDWPSPLNAASTCAEPEMDPVRCVGMLNTDRSSMHPRMHHKFAVFGDLSRNSKFVPKVAWTGSFNLTFTASRSLENAVIFRNRRIASAYASEFAQLALLSEPLNWQTDWCSPEWRIGT